jgi:hypothetical protein
MTSLLGSVTLHDRSAARTLERVVDAAMGLPRRGEGIPIGRGLHAPRNTAFDWRWGQSQESDGHWMYPYYKETRHLVMRSLMLSPSEIERQSIVQKAKADDEFGNTAGYLSGVFRSVLCRFEEKLWNNCDFVGVSLYSDRHTIIWRRSRDENIECTSGEFADSIGFPGKLDLISGSVAVDMLAHLDRIEFDGFRWFALPTVLAGPNAFRSYLVGVPLGILNTTVSIKERPDVSPLFTGVLDAAIYLCGANLMRYSDREFHVLEELTGLVPHLRLAQVILGGLLSACEGDPPQESLAAIFDEVSRTPYEGRGLHGQLFLGKKENFELPTELAAALDFSDRRLVRKALEVHGDDVTPVADCDRILGLGQPVETAVMKYTRVRFRPKGGWMVGQAGVTEDLFSFQTGSLVPVKAQPDKEFLAVFESVFGVNTNAGASECWKIVEEVRKQLHGAMVVISSKAVEEAKRLRRDATLSLVPSQLEPKAALALSRIDGALLLDEDGRCHAAGVIVDGLTSEEKEPCAQDRSRGARYNSASRYWTLCESEGRSTLIIVVSEDGYFNTFPPVPHPT